ncbi:MAG: aminodeoxychorismate synthase component I [Gemmataceae bacterium]
MSVIPVVQELTPAPDPWEVARKLSALPHLLFLDSRDRHPTRGRYSYVTANPQRFQRVKLTESKQAFPELDPVIRKGDLFHGDPALPPFRGGLAGLFGYGLQRATEAIPAPHADEFALPDLAVGVYDWVVSFDHVANRAWIVSTGYDASEGRFRESLARKQLLFVRQILENPEPARFPTTRPHPEPLTSLKRHRLSEHPPLDSNFSREEYLRAVQRVVDYIHAGDAFQVNLSQRLLTPLRDHPLEQYDRLRRACPSPYACYFDAGEFQILSASPEQFLQVSPRGEVVTRPIKGTRPRGTTVEADQDLLHDLVTNPKDRSENVMIVDLMRNDLGRVCEFGSVTVPKVCQVETYNYVHHLVSEVRGQLSPGKTALDLLEACFPGGSVTGAPKVRAMEIIAELEPTARGPYCGSMGFIGFDGAMDTNILIRTMTAAHGWLQFPVGGGIVADSLPELEYEETLHKAAGIIRSLV